MRVLMLVSEAPPIKSGIARVAGKLTEGLRARGINLDVLSANEIYRLNVKEFRISSLLVRWPAIQRRLRNYDVLHIHGTVPTFSDVALVLGDWAREAYPRLGIVYTHHSDIDIAGLEKPAGVYNSFHSRLLARADHVVASTASYAQQLESYARPGRVSAVGFGVDAARFRSPAAKPERFNVLFVGQLRPYKGVDVLLRAWRDVPNADLHIVGSGHEGEQLQQLTRELGLDSVHFHGPVPDAELTRFYAEAHVLVLPSTRKAEAFGLVLLEGMAAGCVPVSSDLPGVRDVVGNSGFTFPVGDATALAAVLRRLQDDPAARQAQAERAAARAVGLAWDWTVDAYDGIYRQVHLGRAMEVQARRGPLTQAALQEWLHAVADQAGADRASLMRIDGRRNELRIAASVGLYPIFAQSVRLPIGQRLSGFAAQTGRPLRWSRRATPALARLYQTDPRLTSALILPLGPPGATVGVLNLARGPERTAFTAADEQWLHRLALQVGPLIRDYNLPEAVP
ncbi:MAG TPA: glycosyltransferase, partial [Chloroflexia bacterium]|nr:glycosyltransferase [Chloroflexia bacterium]